MVALNKKRRLTWFLVLELIVGGFSLFTSGIIGSLLYLAVLVIPLIAFEPFVEVEGRLARGLYSFSCGLVMWMWFSSLR